ncbi:DUF1593 domain-containing protein [Paraglaciecola aquimarina]|uniref:DUF1593 domain-containing protein n=1 Tax=Paraglaciecola algarum TaxID=3050085 RepID=A0ABS9D9K6_9ALTE|nr:DUF1593 domain-containing protein [Paraglaciecola sp. G1-23]MCF2949604.1 DUF1593 domain-containing protein [Paraglaciecola sp. G1-23]
MKLFLICICLIMLSVSTLAKDIEKHRTIILTDIEADPDDTQSLIRLFLYANQIEIRGLVATTSAWYHHSVEPESIVKVINAYGQVQANLNKHQPGYPSAKSLLKLVKTGLPVYGMLGVGDGHDSEGSDWIIQELERKDQRPLWISVWGGVNTLAQALYKIRETKPASIAKEMIAKIRVYTISDQDDSALWIRENFPQVFYIVSPGDSYAQATWTGINTFIDGIDNTSISNKWFAKNIQQNHGPLGARYPDVAWGVEGDTPAFLSLIPNGLNHAEKPNWGGWGGRYEYYLPDFSKVKDGGSIVTIAPETRPIWTNADDKYTPYVAGEYGRSLIPSKKTFEGYKETLWRWRDDFQNDFAARMDWTIKSYEDANHPPVPVLKTSDRLTVKSGEGFTLDASHSTDPDGDNLTFLWFDYPEAGTYKKPVKISAANNAHAINVETPEVNKTQTFHIILKLSDKGYPVLTSYKRIVVTVEPK